MVVDGTKVISNTETNINPCSDMEKIELNGKSCAAVEMNQTGKPKGASNDDLENICQTIAGVEISENNNTVKKKGPSAREMLENGYNGETSRNQISLVIEGLECLEIGKSESSEIASNEKQYDAAAIIKDEDSKSTSSRSSSGSFEKPKDTVSRRIAEEHEEDTSDVTELVGRSPAGIPVRPNEQTSTSGLIEIPDDFEIFDSAPKFRKPCDGMMNYQSYQFNPNFTNDQINFYGFGGSNGMGNEFNGFGYSQPTLLNNGQSYSQMLHGTGFENFNGLLQCDNIDINLPITDSNFEISTQALENDLVIEDICPYVDEILESNLDDKILLDAILSHIPEIVDAEAGTESWFDDEIRPQTSPTGVSIGDSGRGSPQSSVYSSQPLSKSPETDSFVNSPNSCYFSQNSPDSVSEEIDICKSSKQKIQAESLPQNPGVSVYPLTCIQERVDPQIFPPIPTCVEDFPDTADPNGVATNKGGKSMEKKPLQRVAGQGGRQRSTDSSSSGGRAANCRTKDPIKKEAMVPGGPMQSYQFIPGGVNPGMIPEAVTSLCDTQRMEGTTGGLVRPAGMVSDVFVPSTGPRPKPGRAAVQPTRPILPKPTGLQNGVIYPNNGQPNSQELLQQSMKQQQQQQQQPFLGQQQLPNHVQQNQTLLNHQIPNQQFSQYQQQFPENCCWKYSGNILPASQLPVENNQAVYQQTMQHKQLKRQHLTAEQERLMQQQIMLQRIQGGFQQENQQQMQHLQQQRLARNGPAQQQQPEMQPAERKPQLVAQRSQPRSKEDEVKIYREIAAYTTEKIITPDQNGCTMLHMAAVHGEKAIMQLEALIHRLKREGKLEQVLTMGGVRNRTPLCMAVLYNNPESVKLLLEHGADVNARVRICHPDSVFEVHLLHIVAEKGHMMQNTLQQMLTQKNVEVNCYNSNGLTPLHTAVISHKMNKHQGPSTDSQSFIYRLAEYGADLNIQDRLTGRTPLHYAIEKKDKNFVMWYLELCVHAAFNFAPMSSQQPNSNLLVRKKCLQMRTHEGKTALDIAMALTPEGPQKDEMVKCIMEECTKVQ